jgi:L-fucose isomerase-like protein
MSSVPSLAPLRIGLAAVVRSAFKGDAEALAARAAEAVAAEGPGLGHELVAAPELATDPAAAERVASWAKGAGLDFLLVLHATFSTGDVLVPLLRALPQVGLWAVPESEGLPLKAPGVAPGRRPLPLNSLCGLNMTLSLLDHERVGKRERVKWFWGAPGSDDFRRRWRATVAALRGLRAVSHARILQIGGTAPAFYGLEERPALAGVQLDRLPLAALYARMQSIPEDAVRERAQAWTQREPLSGAEGSDVLVAARTELALAALAAGGDYQALALRCWPEFPEDCRGMACAAVGAMADRLVPTACEGDVMGALSMLALQAVAAAPSALLDVSDLDPLGDRLLLWHCGNAPAAFAGKAGARLTTHFNRDGAGVVRDMRLSEGPASAFRLLGGGRRAVVISGSLEGASEPDVDGVRGWLTELRWDGEPRRAAEVMAQVLDAGLPHHLALAPGEHTEALHELVVRLGGRVLPAARVRDALCGPAPQGCA